MSYIHTKITKNVHDVIKDASTFAIVTHQRPDIDAISSSLAIFWYLVSIGKEKGKIHVIIPEFSEEFNFIPGSNYIQKKIKCIKDYDVLFTLDCPAEEFMATSVPIPYEHDIWIDHHRLNAKADYKFLDVTAPSSTSLIYENFKCDNECYLKCIAYGLISDTQNLKVNCNELAQKIISDLKVRGFDINELRQRASTVTGRSKELALTAIQRGKFITKDDNSIFCTYLLQSDLLDDEKSLQTVNHKSIITYIENIVDYTSLILLLENNNHEFKGSLRTFSNKLDLNIVCQRLTKKDAIVSGGGHPYSSGFTVSSTVSPDKIFNDVKTEIFK